MMRFDKFVTDYDDSLSGDTYIDPLGVLVIWSTFGRGVFKSRVNSISNDVRNYTINLINHLVIHELIEDEQINLSKALVNVIGEKTSLSFRQACLIYLENLITYILVDAGKKVDPSGILGGSKARQKLDNDSNPSITLSHEAEYQLLVRQLGLGVSGRYKTPFIALNFFNDHYDYRANPTTEETWKKTKNFIMDCNPLKHLFKECKEHLGALINSANHRSDVPPKILLCNVPESLKASCRKALESPQRVGELTRTFWLKTTELDSGAAGVLLKELESSINQNIPIVREKLVRASLNRLPEEAIEDRALLHSIIVIEPLLAEVDLLFTLACSRKNQDLSKIEKEWKSYERDTETLNRLVSRVEQTPEVAAAISGTAFGRYQMLTSLAREPTFEGQLSGLLEYHAWVMRQRGQLPWVSLKGNQVVVQARTALPPERESRPVGHWVNGYYLPQFENLVKGLYGVNT